MAIKKKNLSALRHFITAFLSLLVVVVSITSFTHAWYLFNKTSSGNTIQTGSFSSNIYAFDENKNLVTDPYDTSKPLDLNSYPLFTEKDFSDNIENENCTGDSSTWGEGCENGVPSYGNINGSIITKYIKIVNTSPINIEYSINFHLIGDQKIAGAFEYRITPSSVNQELESEFETFDSSLSMPVGGDYNNFLSINSINNYGTLNKVDGDNHSAIYYRLDFRCTNLNTYYAGEIIELDIVVHTGQIGSLENSEGNIYTVGSINQLQNALKNSLPGDTIRLNQSFDYPYDLTLNKRVSLDLNTFSLSVNNLIVEFANEGVWKLKTPSGSTLTVRNDMYINTPNANVEFQGSYEYSVDAKVGGSVQIGASYSQGLEMLQQFKLTDLDNNLKEIQMLKNSYIFVESNTTIGKISTVEESTWLKIVNYGNIDSINLENVKFIVSSTDSYQIRIESYGQIYGTVSGTDANIKLPFDSNPSNTYIYQSSIASYISVYCQGGGYDNNDVIRDSSAGYVTYIENTDNAIKEYKVILNDNITKKEGTSSLLMGVLLEGYTDLTLSNQDQEGYFESLDEVKAITKLTIVTTRTRSITLTDFYRVGQSNATYFPNLTYLDLSLAYIENDIVTNDSFAYVNLDYLYLPKSTTAIMGSSISNGAFANADIDFVNIPANVINFYDGWDYSLKTVYMETDKLETYLDSIYASSNYLDNLDKATILVSDSLIDHLEELSMSRYDDKLLHYLRYKRRGTLDSSGRYWIKKNAAGNGYIITAVDSSLTVNESTFRIPDTLSLDGINFLPVTEIASYAFTRLSGLHGNLVISDNVKTIGMYAFFNCGATSINTGGVTSLNNRGTFYRNNAASTSFVLPSVTQIKGPMQFHLYTNSTFSAPSLLTISSYDSISEDKYVFDNVGFTSFSAPILQSINNYGIRNLHGLLHLDLSSVTYLGNYALYNSDSILDIDLSSVQTLENYAISNYRVMTSIELDDLIFASNYAINNCDLIEVLDMPNLVLADNYAFYELNDVESITANQLSSANNYAFTGFDSLISVSMNELNYVSNYMLYDAPLLTSLSLPNMQYIDRLYGACPRLATLTMSSSLNVTVGSPVITLKITPRSFQDYEGLVTLSSTNATEIGYQAFQGIDTLKTVYLPNLITAHGYNIFSECKALESVSLDSLTSMGTSMFANDIVLSKVYMPKLESVSELAFYNCTALTRIYDSGHTNNSVGLYAPNITSIRSEAFNNCTGLHSASILKVTSIGDRAFYFDSALATLELRDATMIGNQAFYRCSNLTGTLTLNTNDVIFGDNAFSYTGYSEINIKISSTAPSVDELSPFAYMANLETVTIGECGYQNTTVDGNLFNLSSHKISRFNFGFTIVPSAINLSGFTRLTQYDARYTLVYVDPDLYDSYIARDNSWNIAPEDENGDTVHFIPNDVVTVNTRVRQGYQYVYTPLFLGKTIQVQEPGNWGQTTTQTRLIVYAYIGDPLTANLTIQNSTTYYVSTQNNNQYSQYQIRYIGYGCFSNMDLANPENETTVNLTITGMTEIGDRAFFRLTSLGTLTLNSMESYHSYIQSGSTDGTFISDSSYITGDIGNYLFTFCGAYEIQLAAEIVAVNDYMFAYTSNLSILGNVENFHFIGYRAFYKTALPTLSLPSIVSILGLAFEQSEITSLTLGNSWTYAAYNCFDETTKLIDINIDSVNEAFNQDVETFELATGCIVIVYYPADNEEYLFSFPGLYILLSEHGNAGGAVSTEGFVYMPFNASATEIEITGYMGDDTTLVIPNTINGFTVVSISASVTGLENVTTLQLNADYRVYKVGCFDSLTSLTTFTVANGNSYFTANNGVLYADGGITLVKYPINKAGTSFTIPSNGNNRVSGIYANAFKNCVNLQTFVGTNYLTSIGDQAFVNSSITSYQFVNQSTPPMLGSGNIFNIGVMEQIRIRNRYATVFNTNPFWLAYSEYFTFYN